MKYFLPFFVVFAMLIGCEPKPADPVSHETVDELVPEEAETIFNDRDLTGWRTKWNAEASVDSGQLIITAKAGEKSGWLLSEGEYNNFRFEVEYLLDPEADGAITFRFPDTRSGDPAASGYAISLAFTPDTQNPIGSIINLARAKWVDSLEANTWVNIQVQATEDYLMVLLNDQLVAETHSRRSRMGHIGFKPPENGGKMVVRNLRMSRMPDSEYTGPIMEDYLRNAPGVDWKPMVNGNSLDGWKEQGPGKWRIRKGVITGRAGSDTGWLITEKAYKNFHMKLKFRIDKEENSGIFIRRNPTDADVSLQNAIECNIYDHNGPSHAYSTGSIVTFARAWYGMIDFGEWNTMEILAFEDQIALFINGRKASEAGLPQFNRAGNICLQAGMRIFSEDKGPSKVEFKDLFIREMDGLSFLGE